MPLKRSAIHHRQVALGARLAQQAGWEWAESFGNAEQEQRRARSGVVVVDLSPLGKLLIRGTGVEAWVGGPGGAVPVGHVAPWDRAAGARLCRLSYGDALVLAAPDETASPVSPRVAPVLERSFVAEAKGCLHLVDITSGRTGIGLVGPRSRDVLVKLTALDVGAERMPDARCAQTALAQVAALVVRQDVGGVPAYEVYVARDLGEYVWEAVLDAGAEFGIAPCGWTAYTRLGARSAAA